MVFGNSQGAVAAHDIMFGFTFVRLGIAGVFHTGFIPGLQGGRTVTLATLDIAGHCMPFGVALLERNVLQFHVSVFIFPLS